MARVNFVVTEAVLEDLRAEFGKVGPPPASIKVMTALEAEGAAMVVCAEPPGVPGGNVLTWCHDCGRAIVHRTHAPRAPIKVCLGCFARRARGIHGR